MDDVFDFFVAQTRPLRYTVPFRKAGSATSCRGVLSDEHRMAPHRRLTTIVLRMGGAYRFSRNPLYVAMTLLYLGLTFLFNSWWGVALLIPVLVVLHFGVVRREERYLERKFGEEYLAYRSQVRRYL
jgi:protein-S-isoprenylcysteine O-methyltransferase Ste14